MAKATISFKESIWFEAQWDSNPKRNSKTIHDSFSTDLLGFKDLCYSTTTSQLSFGFLE
jgi:hypothetical protein